MCNTLYESSCRQSSNLLAFFTTLRNLINQNAENDMQLLKNAVLRNPTIAYILHALTHTLRDTTQKHIHTYKHEQKILLLYVVLLSRKTDER